MNLGIIALGHGGGVSMGQAGNTNFAIVPGLRPEFIDEGAIEAFGRQAVVDHILRTHPYWLIDCGPETALRLCGAFDEADPRVPDPIIQNIQGIVLTHGHNDHAGGLPILAWRTKFVEKVKIRLVAAKSLMGILQNQLTELLFDVSSNGGLITLNDFFTFDLLHPDHRAVTYVDGGSVTLFAVDHNIQDFPAFGVSWSLVDDEEVKTVVFSGDSSEVIRPYLLEAAEVVFHDCQFYNDGSDGTHVHCPYQDLLDLPEEIRRKVVLAHTLTAPPDDVFQAGFRWASKNSIFFV